LDLGLLQKEVAEQIGVDTASIVNWESNRILLMVDIAIRGSSPFLATIPAGQPTT